jgi:two-component system, sensor histidine kinase ChiS
VTDPQLSNGEPVRHPLPSSLIHDLRTPLNLIIGYSEMLIEQAEEQGQGDFVSDLQKTRAAGKQLLALINDNFHPVRALEKPAGIITIYEEPTPVKRESAAIASSDYAAASRPAHDASLQGCLLVVDDVEANRDVLSRRLERQGYVVATAENGRQALGMLRASTFDLVLLDIMMPEMDGYEVLHRLKADQALRDIPVIMISGLSELDAAVRCIELGAEDYLPKPFNPTLLKARIGACLEKKRAKQTERELEAAKQLLETSRQAGMAEVATSILHNVGNVLNSVNVSSGVIFDKIQRSKVTGLTKVVALMNAHRNDLSGFFESDPKGAQLHGYLAKLDINLAHERKEILQEVHTLQGNILHIKEIVAMQQDFARVSGIMETLRIEDLLEDALRLNSGAFLTIKLVREYAQMPSVFVDKHKVLQILVNLISNAKHAFDGSGSNEQQITLRVTSGNQRFKIAIIDNGMGIPAENLIRIFNHGFTTKKDGHGFGLHSGALTAKELGGTLTACSEGVGRGSTFTLELPLAEKNGLSESGTKSRATLGPGLSESPARQHNVHTAHLGRQDAEEIR